MDWQLTRAGIFKKAAAGASAASGLAARYVPRLARRGGAVSLFIDGKTLTIAIVLPQNGHSRVDKTAAVTLDEDAMANPQAAGQAIAKALEGLRRPPKALVAALPAEMTFERRIALPPMPVEETDAAVIFQADRVLPFPAGEMRVDYAVESTGADGVQSVVICAVTVEAADKVEAIAQAAGLSTAAIFAAPSALYALTAATDDAATGATGATGARAVINARAEGFEIAVGVARAAAISRFARGASPENIFAELRRTASSAGIDIDKGALVFAPREIEAALSSRDSTLRVRALEEALQARAGTPGVGGEAAAIAAGTLYVRGIPLPNFHESSASARRKHSATLLQGRIVKYVAAGAAVIALAGIGLGSYWVYTMSLEAKARDLAAANSALKLAVARAETARPWISSRAGLLDVLSGVTEVFPDSSDAFVKSLSIAESGKISIQGRVPGPRTAYDLVAALSKVKGFQNVKLDSGAADASGGYNFGISFEAEGWRAKK